MSSDDEKLAKKKLKEDKKRKRDEGEKKLSKEERKKLKASKKQEKEALLEKIPKVDEHGIAYTKIQIKRMLKRVKRGLTAVPTEEEERARIRNLKKEEKETQDELAGMLFKKETKDAQSEDEEDGDSARSDEGEDDNDAVGDNVDNLIDESDEETDAADDKGIVKAPQKKKPRSKEVPGDYVCYACKNAHKPLHWIYDCPDKIHKPGSNQVKKKLRGLHDPSSRKVFLSGLPFDVKAKEVEAYFEKEMKCGKVVNCKLLMFEDTKRCKGTGFLTFDSDEGAKKALKLNGTAFNLNNDKQTKKQLTLGVKKMMNKALTKSK